MTSPFRHKRTITIDSASLTENAVDHVLYVPLDEKILPNIRADGRDMLFKDASGNILAHHLQRRDVLTSGIGWTWVFKPKAVYGGGKTFLTGVRGEVNALSGLADNGRSRWNVVAEYDHATGAYQQVDLFLAPYILIDDHNDSSLHVLPDGRLMLSHAARDSTGELHLYRTVNPYDISAWEDKVVLPSLNANPTTATYPWMTYLSDPGRLYVFYSGYIQKTAGDLGASNFRGQGYFYSDDLGDTWSSAVELHGFTAASTATFPYHMPDSNGKDTIHFFVTRDHWDAASAVSGVWHYRLQNSGSGDSLSLIDGTPLAFGFDAVQVYSPSAIDWVLAPVDGNPSVAPLEMDQVGAPNTPAGSNCVPCDVMVDADGNPHAIFSRGKHAYWAGQEHIYWHIWHDGTSWNTEQMVNSGGHRGPSEYVDGQVNWKYSPGAEFLRSDTTCSTVWLSRGPDPSTTTQDNYYWNIEKWEKDTAWKKVIGITHNEYSELESGYDLDGNTGTVGIGRQSRSIACLPTVVRGAPAGIRGEVLFLTGRYAHFIAWQMDVRCWPPLLPGVHVKVPTISSSANTEISIEYGNPLWTRTFENREKVWSDYIVAWNAQFATGNSRLLDDRGRFQPHYRHWQQNNGDTVGAYSALLANTYGVGDTGLGVSALFNPSNATCKFRDSAADQATIAAEFPNLTKFGLEFLLNPHVFHASSNMSVAVTYASGANAEFFTTINRVGQFPRCAVAATALVDRVSSVAVTAQDWNSIVWSYDHGTRNVLQGWVNGVSGGTTASNGAFKAGTPNLSTRALVPGFSGADPNNGAFRGQMQIFRIRRTAPSAGSAVLFHRQYMDKDNLLTFGAAESA